MNDVVTNYAKASQEIEKENIIATSAVTLTSDGEAVGFNDTHTLSRRALGNFCKDMGIPKKMLTDNSEEVINQLFREQIVNKNVASFRYSALPTDEIVFIQNSSEPFLAYSEFLNAISDLDVQYIDGTYLEDDSITAYTRESSITVEGREYGVGLAIKMSSTFRTPFRIDYAILTPSPVVFTLPQTKKNAEDINFDSVRLLVSEKLEGLSDFAETAKTLIREALSFALTPYEESVLGDMQESRHIPMALIKNMREAFEEFQAMDPEACEDNFKQAGITDMGNLWEYICFGTYIAQRMDKISVREKCEKGLLQWGYYRLHPKF